MSDSIKPGDILPPLKKAQAADRLDYCLGMLYLHGFITRTEAIRVRKRLDEWENANRFSYKET